jgi:hypothetical protein
MRPLVRVVLLAAIGIMPIVYAGGLAAAQGATPEPLGGLVAGCEGGRTPTDEEIEMLMGQDGNDYLAWEGVCRPIFEEDAAIEPQALQQELPELSQLEQPLPETVLAEIEAASESGRVFQPYAVGFDTPYAAVPRIVPEVLPEEAEGGEPEFMLVFVREGTFVLDLYANAEQEVREIYVWTAGSGIPTMNPWDMTANPDKPHYTETGAVLTNDDGSDCTAGCLVTEEVPVLLQPGDFAIAESGAICTYCLAQNSIDENAIPLLEVYVGIDPAAIPDGFSWVQSWDYIQEQAEEPRAGGLASDAPVMLGWALPNLGTGCKDG